MRMGIACLTLLLAGCASLRPAEPPGHTPMDAPGDSSSAATGDPRPYGDVITDRAVTQEGLFRTHRLGDTLYFEIPREQIGTEMLLVTSLERNTGGGLGGVQMGDRVLVWERQGERILLRTPIYGLRADSAQPIHRAIDVATFPIIIAAFDIKAFGPDSAAVIDVSKLYTGNVREFRIAQDGVNLEGDRTFIDDVATYPGNIEVKAAHTYTVTPPPLFGLQFPPQTASVLMRWSMVKLPERPMAPRLADSRVGYFSVGVADYGTDEHRVARYRYINRWRLECPPGETIPCTPAKPIVFYVDPATPEQWVPYVKAGVEAWQVAFEDAGFERAIVARDAPDPEEDPTWSPDDARYSVVRWLPTTEQNAMGPHVHDPRTGEILQSSIRVYHNVLNLLRNWYITQVAPLDPRAARLPLPDTLMGRLLQYVITHEVGHTLGFPHNFKAASTYPVDSLRSETFLRRMGHVPSVMDYARFNYLVQPEDSIPPDLLVPGVGPYDRFAIRWGYRPIPGATTPEEERETLSRWAREQDTKPWLRYSTEDSGDVDSEQLTEAVGSADAVRATSLALRNIRRTVPMLIPATTQPGRDFSDLKELYGRLVTQWQTVLNHVVATVGTVTSREIHGDQEGVRFRPRPAPDQRQAMAFLNENAFATPRYLLDREILRRIEPMGALDRIGRAQEGLLEALLRNQRLQMLLEFEALAGPDEEVYTVAELSADLRRGLWAELRAGRVRIDPFRRGVQNVYLARLDETLNPDPDSRDQPPADAQAQFRMELEALAAEIRGAVPRAADRATRAHLAAARARIARILEPPAG